VWLTLVPEDDPALFWASVCSGLKRASAAPPELIRVLEDGPASTFPLRLAEMARLFSKPTVIVLDNVDNLTDEYVLTGLNLLARHAPPNLRLVMCGRRPPRLYLSKLRASGDLAEIGPAALRADFANPPGDERPEPSSCQPPAFTHGR
jgi:LuxR family maltose regulon positive regulatory protein